MITVNIGWMILIGIILVTIGFCVSAFFAGSKIGELDAEISNLKIDNNRKDTVIKFYQSQNIKDNTDKSTKTLGGNK